MDQREPVAVVLCSSNSTSLNKLEWEWKGVVLSLLWSECYLKGIFELLLFWERILRQPGQGMNWWWEMWCPTVFSKHGGAFSHPSSNSLLQGATTQRGLHAPTSPAFLGSTVGKFLFALVHPVGEELHSSSSAGCIWGWVIQNSRVELKISCVCPDPALAAQLSSEAEFTGAAEERSRFCTLEHLTLQAEALQLHL